MSGVRAPSRSRIRRKSPKSPRSWKAPRSAWPTTNARRKSKGKSVTLREFGSCHTFDLCLLTFDFCLAVSAQICLTGLLVLVPGAAFGIRRPLRRRERLLHSFDKNVWHEWLRQETVALLHILLDFR